MEPRALTPSSLAGLLGPVCLCLSTGCADWPHFDYEESPPRQVQEEESAGETEVIQNLAMVTGPVMITGQIDSSRYVPDTQQAAPMDLPGWYAGDMDWFQLGLREPADLVVSLGWTGTEGLLDLYLFRASRENGELTEVIKYALGTEDGALLLSVSALSAADLYVVSVAGHEGDAVSYQLDVTPVIP